MFQTSGLHHVTAIASDPQQTVDFYTQVLGLRLVKKSVNQDSVQTYHLFFGDKTGEPGMDLTFFTFQPVQPGQRGAGQATLISLAVPMDSLQFWQTRFERLQVQHLPVSTRFGLQRLVFFDPDGQQLELVESDSTSNPNQVWTTTEIDQKRAIRAFHQVRFSTIDDRLLTPVLIHGLGYHQVDEEESIELYRCGTQTRAAYLEIETVPSSARGISGAGTVHHVAFAVPDAAALAIARETIAELGLFPTEVIERYYFQSVYFRTPAGILCELATLGPGFTVDESATTLGEKLALPPFLEAQRKAIEAALPTITLPKEK